MSVRRLAADVDLAARSPGPAWSVVPCIGHGPDGPDAGPLLHSFASGALVLDHMHWLRGLDAIADSDPTSGLRETRHEARALLRTLHQ